MVVMAAFPIPQIRDIVFRWAMFLAAYNGRGIFTFWYHQPARVFIHIYTYIHTYISLHTPLSPCPSLFASGLSQSEHGWPLQRGTRTVWAC